MLEETFIDLKGETVYATDLADLRVGEVLYVDVTLNGARCGVQREVKVVGTKFNVKSWQKEYRCMFTEHPDHQGAWVRAEFLHLKGEVQDGA